MLAKVRDNFPLTPYLVLAGQGKIRKILTVDKRDFSIYRFADGGLFERLWIS